MAAGIGGVGGIGAAGLGGVSVGGVGAGSAGGAPTPTTAGADSTRVTLSAAGRALASEPTQPGASLSITQDQAGHNYVNGMDANGAHAPGSVDPLRNVNGQLYAELNKLDKLLEAAILAKLLNGDQRQQDTMCILGAAQVVQAINAYEAISKM